MPQQYIGVYATKEAAPSISEYPRPLVARKRLWFVWEAPEGKYKVQALNAAMQPMSEARVITAKEFSSRYTYEAECFAAPEGYTHPAVEGMDSATVSLPELFAQERKNTPSALAVPPAGPRKGGMHADDPNLLLEWAKNKPQPMPHMQDPAKIPFDRLVGEVVEVSEETASATAGDIPASPAYAFQPVEEGEAQQVRMLRSRFVQALLLLRRGAKNEGFALLEDLLSQQYELFEGGAQLFSEFGLGLRRLGFANLAFAAHKRALELSPKDERVLFNLARSCHDLEMLSEAKEYLEQALAVAPNFAAARQFLAFLDLERPEHGGRR